MQMNGLLSYTLQSKQTFASPIPRHRHLCIEEEKKKRKKKKKKDFTSFGQPTRLITCANQGNNVIPGLYRYSQSRHLDTIAKQRELKTGCSNSGSCSGTGC